MQEQKTVLAGNSGGNKIFNKINSSHFAVYKYFQARIS